MNSNQKKNAKLIESANEVKKQEIQSLLFGPEQQILNKQSDSFLDRLFLEIELRDGKRTVSDVIQTDPREYESIFHRSWFYKLADMLGVSRKVMDTYVKPRYVKHFFIRFVYARLGYRVLRELRAARVLAKANDAKLFQFLKDEYYEMIFRIAREIEQEMEDRNYDAFVQVYSAKYGLAIPQLLF